MIWGRRAAGNVRPSTEVCHRSPWGRQPFFTPPRPSWRHLRTVRTRHAIRGCISAGPSHLNVTFTQEIYLPAPQCCAMTLVPCFCFGTSGPGWQLRLLALNAAMHMLPADTVYLPNSTKLKLSFEKAAVFFWICATSCAAVLTARPFETD